MANNFKIVITASDRATAAIRKVKDGIAQFTRPIRQVKSSIGALGREVGLDKVTAGIGRMARGAEHLASRALGVVSAVAAIGGVTSLAAIGAMTREWTLAGAEILRTAGIIGIGTGKLQTLRGAAVAFGLSAEDMTGGLKALGDTMENALFGRDQQAMAMMNRLSITMKKNRDGSVDTAAGLYDVANAIQRIKNVQAQAVVARTFGVEALLPMLQKGAKGIKEYEAAVAKSGAVLSGPALQRAQQFQYQLALTKLSVMGVANSIMGDLVPSLIPLAQGFTGWAQKNRGVIATDVRGFVLGVVDGVKKLSGVVAGAGGIIEATIGWKGAGVALAFLLAGKLLASIWGLVGPITVLTARLAFVGVTAIPRLMLGVAALCEAQGLPLLARAFLATGIAADTMLGPLGLALAAITALIAGMRWLDAHRDHRVAPSFGGRGRGTPGGLGDKAPHPRAPVDRAAAAQAMAYFQQQGRSKEQAAGLVGNLAYESGLNPAAVGDGGAAYGIAQWHKARQEAFRKFAGHDIRGSSLAEQLRFAQFELTRGAERGAGDLLARSNDAAEASDAVEYAYERPSDRAAAASRYDRQALAQGLADGAPVPAPASAPVAAVRKARAGIAQAVAPPAPAAPLVQPQAVSPAARSAPAAPAGSAESRSAPAAPAGSAESRSAPAPSPDPAAVVAASRPDAPSGRAAAVAAAGRPAPGQQASHTVTVKFENAPKGMKAEVKSSGAPAARATVKIDYAMAELSPP